MQMFKHFFSKSGLLRIDSVTGSAYTPVSIYAEPEAQVVLTNIVGFVDTGAPIEVNVWTVSKRELLTQAVAEVRRTMDFRAAGSNVVMIDNIAGIGIGTKIYIRDDRDNYSQHITNVNNIVFAIPGPGAFLTLEEPLPYDFTIDSRVFPMQQDNDIHCQPASAVTASELTLAGECLVSGPRKSPIHVEAYGADSQLHVAGYWHDVN